MKSFAARSAAQVASPQFTQQHVHTPGKSASMPQWSSLLTRCFGAPPAEQHPAPARCSEPQVAPAKALGHACCEPAFPTIASSLAPAASTTAHWEDALVNLTTTAEAELDARKHKLLQLAPVVAAEVEAEVAAANSQRGSSVPAPVSPKVYKVKLQGQPAATSGLNNSHSYMRRCSDFMMAVQAVQQSAVLRSMQKSLDEQLQPHTDQARYHSMLHTAGHTQQLAQQQRQHPRLPETASAASLFYKGSLDGPRVLRQATSNTCNCSDNSNRAASGLIVNDATHRGAMYVATWQRGLTTRRAERWAALARGAADGNALATLTATYASTPSGPACEAWAGLRTGTTGLSSPFEQQQQLSQLAVTGNERLHTICRSAPHVRPAPATANMTPPTSCEDAEFFELLNTRTANKQSTQGGRADASSRAAADALR